MRPFSPVTTVRSELDKLIEKSRRKQKTIHINKNEFASILGLETPITVDQVIQAFQNKMDALNSNAITQESRIENQRRLEEAQRRLLQLFEDDSQNNSQHDKKTTINNNVLGSSTATATNKKNDRKSSFPLNQSTVFIGGVTSLSIIALLAFILRQRVFAVGKGEEQESFVNFDQEQRDSSTIHTD